MTKYYISDHTRRRYIERVQGKDCPPTLTNEERARIDDEILKMIRESEETRSHLNDTEFMFRLYENHGYNARFKFLIKDDYVIITRSVTGKEIIVTIINGSTGRIRKHMPRKKKK